MRYSRPLSDIMGHASCFGNCEHPDPYFTLTLIVLDVDHLAGAPHSSISFGTPNTSSTRCREFLIVHQVSRQNGYDRFTDTNGKWHPLDRKLCRLEACLRLHTSKFSLQNLYFNQRLSYIPLTPFSHSISTIPCSPSKTWPLFPSSSRTASGTSF